MTLWKKRVRGCPVRLGQSESLSLSSFQNRLTVPLVDEAHDSGFLRSRCEPSIISLRSEPIFRSLRAGGCSIENRASEHDGVAAGKQGVPISS